ncbi:helicase-associated domain-containing protein [Rhodococcoides kyotonense]|uniref:Helicase conserved C-terminal domain-containing protein n=1 Tax=Rhodococcoides kyotonense TaxID=398843 RepID=A0A239FB47_9NOCA|nr:helicase-associated domain-containing protein [Rhodococcus kyotonensis]SNS53533.1 Helicase conserved C-terminal domain-containing protein [Rhodococcus kyotonensis]
MTTQEEWLAGLDGDRLTRLLDVRSDIATDLPPRTFAALSQLLQTSRSVARAVTELDASALSVLAAMNGHRTRAELAEHFASAAAEDIDRALDVLVGFGLVWPSGDGYRPSALHGHVSEAEAKPSLARPWPGEATSIDVGVQQLAAARFCETADGVLKAVDSGSIKTLASGGVGVRELTIVSKTVGAENVLVVELILELARAMGLVDPYGKELRGTTTLPKFLKLGRAEKLSRFVATWWCIEASPTHRPPFKGKPSALLRFSPHATYYPGFRKKFLASIPDRGIVDDSRAVDYLEWSCPRFVFISEPGAVLALWREATWLGLLAGNAPSALTRALVEVGLAGPEATQAAIDPIVAELVESSSCTVHLLPDLTAVVSGPVSESVWSVLAAAAESETKDAASTWRFTPTSIRRYLDDGGSTDRLISDLADISDTEIPQNLQYLIEDCGRRHGHLAVHSASSIVVSEDESLVREIATIAELKGRVVAPTVLASSVGPKRVLDILRGAGYSPRDDGGHSQVKVSRTKADETGDVPLFRQRLRTPAAVLARALASGDPVPIDPEAAAAKIGAWCRLPARDVAELASAVVNGRTVHIHAVNKKRVATLDEMSDLVLHADEVHGWSVQANGRKTIELAKIQMVRLV